MRTWVPSSVSRDRATPTQATTGSLSKPRRCPLSRSLDHTTTMRHDVEKLEVTFQAGSRQNAMLCIADHVGSQRFHCGDVGHSGATSHNPSGLGPMHILKSSFLLHIRVATLSRPVHFDLLL
jgi:hypothetical protein